MSILRTTDRPPVWAAAVFAAGTAIVKAAADAPEPAYDMAGTLYLSETGWLLLSVPNALVRGVFSAMAEPGVELPPSGPDGRLNAHCSVMSKEEVSSIGADKITERGKQFRYTVGRLYSVEPEGWPGMERVWFLRVHSPELQDLRRSYGLSSLPDEGRKALHISCAARRRGVLGRSATAKV